MSGPRILLLLLVNFAVLACQAQTRRDLPDVSTTFKGMLVLPVPLGNPLFEGYTETIGQLDGVLQVPIWNGVSLGAGARMTWFALDDRALANVIRSGEVRRASFYGKLAYEAYTGPRTFYELSGRAGSSNFAFDCESCMDERPNVFHWGLAVSYYIHVSDNLAFGLMLGYERDDHRFRARDLGLESFPGRRELSEKNKFQNMVIGMGFSTRFRRSADTPEW